MTCGCFQARGAEGAASNPNEPLREGDQRNPGARAGPACSLYQFPQFSGLSLNKNINCPVVNSSEMFSPVLGALPIITTHSLLTQTSILR